PLRRRRLTDGAHLQLRREPLGDLMDLLIRTHHLCPATSTAFYLQLRRESPTSCGEIAWLSSLAVRQTPCPVSAGGPASRPRESPPRDTTRSPAPPPRGGAPAPLRPPSRRTSARRPPKESACRPGGRHPAPGKPPARWPAGFPQGASPGPW